MRGDDEAVDFGLDIAAVAVVGVAGQAGPAQLRRVAAGQDRDAVEALLPVPHGAVAGRLDIGDRQRFVGAFQFLEAGDVGLLALEPFEQARQPRADAVEVVGGSSCLHPSDGEARAAAAAGGRVGVGHLERGAAEILDEIDRRARAPGRG